MWSGNEFFRGFWVVFLLLVLAIIGAWELLKWLLSHIHFAWR